MALTSGFHHVGHGRLVVPGRQHVLMRLAVRHPCNRYGIVTFLLGVTMN